MLLRFAFATMLASATAFGERQVSVNLTTGYQLEIPLSQLRKTAEGGWKAPRSFRAVLPNGDTLVGPFLMTVSDSSEDTWYCQANNFEVLPLHGSLHALGGSANRFHPLRVGPDGLHRHPGPAALPWLNPKTRWKDIVLNSWGVVSAVALDSLVVEDPNWRIRFKAEPGVRIAEGLVELPTSSSLELLPPPNPVDTLGLRWLPTEDTFARPIQTDRGWKVRAQWGSLEFKLLFLRQFSVQHGQNVAILSMAHPSTQDSIRYSDLSNGLRAGQGSIHLPWKSLVPVGGGWQYKMTFPELKYASLREPLALKWGDLELRKGRRAFTILSRLPTEDRMPWDDSNSPEPEIATDWPPADPIGKLNRLYWSPSDSRMGTMDIKGLGRVVAGRYFRWEGRDSIRLRGILRPSEPWRKLLGSHARIELLASIRFAPDDSNLRLNRAFANTMRIAVDTSSFAPDDTSLRLDQAFANTMRIAVDTSITDDAGRRIEGASGNIWWEPVPSPTSLQFQLRDSLGFFWRTSPERAERLDAVIASPKLAVSRGDTTEFAPTRTSPAGTVVILSDEKTDPIGSRLERTPCPDNDALRMALFRDRTSEDSYKIWQYFQPSGFKSAGGDSLNCFSSYARGFLDPYVTGHLRNLPVVLSAQDLRIAFDARAFPVPDTSSLEFDSSSNGSIRGDSIPIEALPSPIRSFWRALREPSHSSSWEVASSPDFQDRTSSGETAPSGREPGIPRIRLAGVPSTWTAFAKYVDSVASTGNAIGIELRPIAQEIARSAAGTASRPFWNDFVRGRTGSEGWLRKFDPTGRNTSAMAVRIGERNPVGSYFCGFQGIVLDRIDRSIGPRKAWATTLWKNGENPFHECDCTIQGF